MCNTVSSANERSAHEYIYSITMWLNSCPVVVVLEGQLARRCRKSIALGIILCLAARFPHTSSAPGGGGVVGHIKEGMRFLAEKVITFKGTGSREIHVSEIIAVLSSVLKYTSIKSSSNSKAPISFGQGSKSFIGLG